MISEGSSGAVLNAATSEDSAPVSQPLVTKLIGSYEKNIDNKSRIGLPQPFRDKLADHPLIMVRWLNRSIAIFPECNWLPIAEAIARLDYYTEIGLTVRRQIFSHAKEVSMDKEGRIVVPNDMADYGRLDGKIMMMGDWDKILVCSSVYYRDELAEDEVTMTQRFPSVMQLAKGQKSLESFEAELKG
ncbi:MAG: hypothetical protein GC154_05450 [bacterium]|nr:hypothetical protein [bacterium]